MIGLGLVGIGKIARDQHVPALARSSDFLLAATASRQGRVPDVPGFSSVGEMMEARPDIQAVSLCTPPDGRFEQALMAIRAGRHVMLEKPPAMAVSAAELLAGEARAHGVALFTTWHSREAACVDKARDWLAGRRIDAVRIRWMEDIRRWHPGQQWILAAGGFGVFDPGVNALSIATHVLPQPLRVVGAVLETPAGRACPIAATMHMVHGADGAMVDARFDFRQEGPQSWDIEVKTDAGTLRLSMGGSVLDIPGAASESAADEEYIRLYARFAALVRARECDVDLRPLRLVADAFMVAERHVTAPFDF